MYILHFRLFWAYYFFMINSLLPQLCGSFSGIPRRNLTQLLSTNKNKLEAHLTSLAQDDSIFGEFEDKPV